MEFEKYKENLNKLIDWNHSLNDSLNRNEATTRLHLIDTLLFECLNWQKEDCIAEEAENKEYTDYTFHNPHRVMIVEAKREGVFFELPLGLKDRIYKIKTLFSNESKIRDAIEQVVGYCQKRGVSIGIVTNGVQYIILVASRNDGVSPIEGNAIIYKSLEDINNNYLEFWQYLSKDGIIEKRIEKGLLGIDIPVLPTKLYTKIADYPGIKNRNSIQADLQILSDLLLEELVTNEEIEEDFLKSTYCSSGALSQYALISRNILLNRYSLLYDSKVGVPLLEPVYTKKGIAKDFSPKEFGNRPILLLGDVGTGKTMFIKNFMKIEAKEIIDNTISLYIDLGSKAALTKDLKDFFLLEISNLLYEDYDIDVDERNFVRGVYNLELKRFEKGIYGDLKESDPQEFKKKEIEYISTLIQNRENHIKSCIHHIAFGRKKQVVIFMDNVDQRDEKIQEDAFFIAQDVAANWETTVFLTIRPQTYYKSKVEGALTGYHPKAFTIAPPRVDEVIQKRLDFAMQIAKGKKKISCLSDKIFVQLSSLLTYLEILQYSFNDNLELIEFIDNISNGNIRLAVELITTFIGSGHVDTKKIFEKDAKSQKNHRKERYLIPLHEFLRAIIYGDHKYYYPSATKIINVFDITENDKKEHFILPIMIDYLNRASSKSKFGGFVDTKELFTYSQNLGFYQEQIYKGITRAIKQNLIESEARKTPQSISDIPQNLRITTIGVYHVQKLIHSFVYFDAILIDVPVLDRQFKDKIFDCEPIAERLNRATLFSQYLDSAWESFGERQCGFDWRIHSKKLSENIESIKSNI